MPQLFDSVIESLDPALLVSRYLLAHSIEVDAISVLAVGKAAVGMMGGAKSVLGGRIQSEVVVAPSIPPGSPPGWMESDHPNPTKRSEVAAEAMLRAVASAQGPVLVLISGGGSALAAQPAAELSLEAKTALLRNVSAAGANIVELNTVRKHLSAIKGGRLAAASAQPVTTLVLSDVLGDCLSVVASGPTIADPSTYDDALGVVRRFCGADAAGPAVDHLIAGSLGRLAETPKESRECDHAVLLAGIGCLTEHAARIAQAGGAHVRMMAAPLAGTVFEVRDSICDRVLAVESEGPGLVIAGGEATMVLPLQPGLGGRAQHLALLLAERIAGRANVQIMVAGSDGIDGNSKAAGAVVDGTTWRSLVQADLDPSGALERCDSARVLAAIGAQIVTGPTGVNHADLVVVQIS